MNFWRIAIVGAGFAGAALAYFLRDRQVTLFDAESGASRIAPGLLHPHPGRESEFSAATKLIEIAGSDVIHSSGILHIPRKPVPGTWWDAAQCQAHFPGSALIGGIFYPEGLTINAHLYLQRLMALSGAHVERRRITHLDELADYDATIIAAGAASAELTSLPLKQTKGQLLQLAWPGDFPPPPFSIIGNGYLTSTLMAGATYEHHFVDTLPHPDEAAKIILPKVAAFYPQLADAKILGCRAAIRCSPLIRRQLSSHLFVLTGFGSHGLLHHAHEARQLASLLE